MTQELTRAQAVEHCAQGKHRLGAVPPARFRGRSIGTEALGEKYPHGAVVCADCLLIWPARPGEIKGLPDITDLWAKDGGCESEEDRLRKVGNANRHGGPGGARKLPAGRWARRWDACRACGSSDQPHRGLGLCPDCYYMLVTAPRNRENADRRLVLRRGRNS